MALWIAVDWRKGAGQPNTEEHWRSLCQRPFGHLEVLHIGDCKGLPEVAGVGETEVELLFFQEDADALFPSRSYTAMATFPAGR